MTRREQIYFEIDKRKYRADCPFDYEDGFKRGVEWADKHPKSEMVNKQEFIEKVKRWLENNMRVKTTSYADVWDDSEIDQVVSDFYTIEEMIDSFCKVMEE